MKIVVSTNLFQGDLVFDNFSLTKNINGNKTSVALKNASFDGGHQQFSTGDFAATYLSRLNGAAFFGSMSHHNTGGHSFGLTAANSILHLLRGMPLGEAVWLGDPNGGLGSGGSGVLYGDPLYSPVSIQIRPNVGATSINNLKAGYLPLVIDALNGRDSTKVSTKYKVDVCHDFQADFAVCNSWEAVGISGASGGKNIPVTINAASFPSEKTHTLRLTVETKNLESNSNQIFQSFFTFYGIGKFLVDSQGYDTDGDGVSDDHELYVYRSRPDLLDSDGDGLSDGDEVIRHTSPAKVDSDSDGLSDGDEVNLYNSDPKLTDTDGDGHSDSIEVKDGTNRRDPNDFKVHQIPAALWQRMVD